jgi:hypothetical protein
VQKGVKEVLRISKDLVEDLIGEEGSLREDLFGEEGSLRASSMSGSPFVILHG